MNKFNRNQIKIIDKSLEKFTNDYHFRYYREFLLSEAFYKYYFYKPSEPVFMAFQTWKSEHFSSIKSSFENDKHFYIKDFNGFLNILCFGTENLNLLRLTYIDSDDPNLQITDLKELFLELREKDVQSKAKRYN